MIITIVILLILAGVTISTLNKTNIFEKSKKATDAYKKSQENEINTLAEYEQSLSDYTKGKTTTPTTPTTITFESIKVGDNFKYTPSADSSFTVPTYKGVNNGSVATLSTENLTWKVWKKTSDSILITPTTPTKATLKLGSYSSDTTDDNKRDHAASAYNNAVQALNAYCRKYYSDTTNGIIARNVNIDDIESSMTEAGKNARDSFSNGTYIYGKTGNPSTKKYYPRLYTSEEPETSTSLGLSDSPDKDNIYAAFTGTSFSKNGASDYASGYKQTQYYFSSSDLTSKKYYDDKTLDLLFSATGYGSGYWVASRCVNVYSRWAVFRVCSVHADGNLCPWDMFASNGYTTSGAIALRPVVSIPASKISAYVSQ